MQHEIIQSILKEAIPFTESQIIPIVKLKQGHSASGYWSLWHLEVKNQFENSQIIQPIFFSSEGEHFTAFAQNVWDKLIQENDFFDCIGVLPVDESKKVFTTISQKSESVLQLKYEEFEARLSANTDRIKSDKEKAFSFQEKQMNRIGIENIRQSRLKRLMQEKEVWANTFSTAKQIVPNLSCLLMINVVNE